MIALAGTAQAAELAPHLRALIKDARLAVQGEVTAVTPYDDGRIAVAEVRVVETLKGRSETALRIIETRETSLPPIFEAGRYVVAFLKIAPSNSYLARHLPAGRYFSVLSRTPASFAAASADEAKNLGQMVSRLISIVAKPDADAAKRAAQRRALAFDLLAARNATIVADGIASLADRTDLAQTLTADEQARIEATIARDDLSVQVRLALLRVIGDLGLTQLVAALQRVDNPALVGGAWEALSKLSSAPSRESIEEKLASPEPRIRIAAVEQLLRKEKGAAVPQAVRVATSDSDVAVRVAATQALGQLAPADAVPALETVYKDPSWETRQAVARTLRQLPGRTAVEAFERMAFTAPKDGQRYAVVLLLLSVNDRQDPLLQHVIKDHPDPEIRRLAEHGIETGHH